MIGVPSAAKNNAVKVNSPPAKVLAMGLPGLLGFPFGLGHPLLSVPDLAVTFFAHGCCVGVNQFGFTNGYASLYKSHNSPRLFHYTRL
jgi:hypothetical protein